MAFVPNWISPPGETVAELMVTLGWNEEILADEIGLSRAEIVDLIAGRAPLTVGVSRSLAQALGGSLEFWMAREYQYREDLSRLYLNSTDWLANLPVKEMAKFGWIENPRDGLERFFECMRFFGVPSVDAWHVRYHNLDRALAFRTSPTYASSLEAVATWVRRGELEATSMPCDSWDPELLQSLLIEIRNLSRQKDPRRFIPALQDLLSRCGVAFVLVKAPTGCKASGVAKFVTAEKALILLSGRYRSDDHFWFTICHEIGHLLLHGKNGVFVDDPDPASMSPLEHEANSFAADLLIPPTMAEELGTLRGRAEEVIRFARRVGVSPGIVVGQMQHRGFLARNRLNGLKRRYTW